jgi:broad-specificity NMP kinase
MRWIELAGIPGSGKTTLYKALVSRYRQSGQLSTIDDFYAYLISGSWSYKQRLKAWLAGGFTDEQVKSQYLKQNLEKKLLYDYMLAHIAHLRYFLEAMGERNADEEKNTLNWMLRVFAYRHAAEQVLNRDQVLLIDEGFCQRLITLCISPQKTPVPGHLERYPTLLPSLDTVIYLKVDVDTAYKRIQERGLPLRLQGKSEQEIRQFLSDADNALETAVQTLAAQNVPVMTVPQGWREGFPTALDMVFGRKV